MKNGGQKAQKQPQKGAPAHVTPCEEYPSLASKLGLPGLFLKREDLHPYGSHKGRSIPHMIDTYAKKGSKEFAISSSGNAALAAAMHIKKIGESEPLKITLDIFIGQHANRYKVEKLEALEDEQIKITVKERPIQALTLAEQDGATSLRQSTNDLALEGYASLAQEIADTLEGKNGAVFVGSSSGTTAQALAQYFIENNIPIQVHIVQTSSCHPLVDAFKPTDIPNEDSLADAIVDQTAFRKNALIPLIQKTGGKGWIATNDLIETAQSLTYEYTDVELSPNGALGIAGALKAVYENHQFKGPVVCIVCGE